MRQALLKVAIVLIPSYFSAWLTGQMVWVVPTLVASGFFAASIGNLDRTSTTRVDEDGGDGDGGDEGQD